MYIGINPDKIPKDILHYTLAMIGSLTLAFEIPECYISSHVSIQKRSEIYQNLVIQVILHQCVLYARGIHTCIQYSYTPLQGADKTVCIN